jgi:hypothetical protein
MEFRSASTTSNCGLQRDQPVTGNIQRHRRHRLQSSGLHIPAQGDTPGWLQEDRLAGSPAHHTGVCGTQPDLARAADCR